MLRKSKQNLIAEKKERKKEGNKEKKERKS